MWGKTKTKTQFMHDDRTHKEELPFSSYGTTCFRCWERGSMSNSCPIGNPRNRTGKMPVFVLMLLAKSVFYWSNLNHFKVIKLPTEPAHVKNKPRVMISCIDFQSQISKDWMFEVIHNTLWFAQWQWSSLTDMKNLCLLHMKNLSLEGIADQNNTDIHFI